MNLVVDVGNTQIKFAVFDQDQIIEKLTSNSENAIATLKMISKAYPEISQGIISSTAQIENALHDKLSQILHLVEFSHESKLNFINNYKTPKTLGLDRIALVAAAAYMYPFQNVLVIDAGTCITYDFINKKSVYQGGAISAGVQMRLKAMHSFTGKLPLVTEVNQTEVYLGKTTKEAMQIGVYKSIVYEIEGYIDEYLTDYEDLTVVLTGGDSILLSASIKNSIFATQNFLLKGLNKILQLNSN